jgi:processive 1,2-diacylglycerol beta-glucosyltransferase
MIEPVKNPFTVSLYFSDTGGGHRGAADAIQSGIERVLEGGFPNTANICFVKKSIAEKYHPMTNCMCRVYNYLARHHTKRIKHYYHLLHLIKPESDFFFDLYRPYLSRLVSTDRPRLIVSTHPMLAHSLTRTVRELGLQAQVKVAVVITDPNESLWQAWACDRADLIVAPNEIVRQRLLSWDVSSKKIQVLGMPVHPGFLSPPKVSRKQFLLQLGLVPEVLTVCLNSSWAGNTHWLDMYRAMARCKRRVQVIFLSGHNQALYREATAAAARESIDTVVLPFFDRMSDLMASVDVMVTKAGGLTTYQALARRLPIIFDKTIEPMPQEAPTLKMLVALGVAQECKAPKDLIEIIDNLKVCRDTHASLPTQHQLNLTDHAIYDIAKALLNLCIADGARTEEGRMRNMGQDVLRLQYRPIAAAGLPEARL